jgi:hypothetical protein
MGVEESPFFSTALVFFLDPFSWDTGSDGDRATSLPRAAQGGRYTNRVTGFKMAGHFFAADKTDATESSHGAFSRIRTEEAPSSVVVNSD